jgi:hypothetical protein
MFVSAIKTSTVSGFTTDSKTNPTVRKRLAALTLLPTIVNTITVIGKL